MNMPVVLVCGFGRCGSSLVMQMLGAGGIPTTGEYPGFEDSRTSIPRDPQWIAEQHGRAVKLIDPQFPDGRLIAGHYRIIWLDRDHRQQSRSQAKFARLLMGLPIDRKGVRALARSYATDLPIALKVLKDRGSVLRIRFEDILLNPEDAARRIHAHIGCGCVSDMAAQVRSRSPKCAPGLDMELSLIAQREHRSDSAVPSTERRETA